MSEWREETTSQLRASRFKEHTNTNNSIRPPPDELWRDLGIEQLIEQYNEENAKPSVSRKSSANRVPSASRPALARNASSTSNGPGITTSVTCTQPTTPAPHGGTYARIQRAVASVFGSVLGKRKAAAMEAEREKSEKAQQQQVLDDRKTAAEAAYHDAKERGLLPTPKVFVRPAMRVASHNSGTPAPPLDKLRLTAAVADAATPNRIPRTPRTPGTLHHTPSKKDLHKQKKLSKRVSNLEIKLASARKELQTVLHSDLSAVPPLPTLQRTNQQEPTPEISQSDTETTPISPEATCSIGQIVKKRKATTHDDDAEYKPRATDSNGDIDLLSAHSASERENEMPTPERMIKRVRSSASKNKKRQSSRLQKRLSRGSLRERNCEEREVEMRVVPDGDMVPDVPVIPREMESLGRRSSVREGGDKDDGFGGLGHEIF
jgi:hypothetical protein